jgi:hypothetical protein
MMSWNYKITSETIWTSFDYGTVEADTLGEAIQKARNEVQSNLDKLNAALKFEDTAGIIVEMDLSQIEVSPANTITEDISIDQN